MQPYARNVHTIKSENRALMLSYIRRGPISRAEIAKSVGMSKSAVTMIINDLIDEGQIREVGATDSAYGRKPILLDIVPDYRYAAGIALHRSSVYVCITDLNAKILSYSTYPAERWDDPHQMLDFLCGEVMRMLEERGISREKCIGIGVSAPGPLDYVSGKILNPPDFALFHYVDAGEYLREKSGMPVMVDNNAVLLAMQEYNVNRQAADRNSMFIVVSDGIGSAILAGGQIFRGSGGFAGELGHISIHADGLPCSCGNEGCLEKYISMKALRHKFGIVSYNKLVDDAYMGDPESMRVLDYISGEFSCAIASAVNLFDLDAVIIYGEFSYRNEKLKQMLQADVEKRSVITKTHPVEVRFSEMTPDQASASVCAAIIQRHFEQKI